MTPARSRPSLIVVCVVVAVVVAAIAWVWSGRTGNVKISDLRVTDAYVPRPASPDVAAAYFTVANSGDVPAVLTGVHTDVSATSMMHRTTGTSMTMLDSVTVPAHGVFVFAPGRYHVMIESPSRTLEPGDHVRLTLSFAKVGQVTVTAPVVPVGYRPPARHR
ncbi:copper chaperone PCu(A)C [Microbispora sp. RL4-1S]|uniref:Copper chaperone PCu(A)C n=1 Tax=Microbispora oryzae TaxID=2806554 RepID=A0A941ALW6_9ACTN|nr:copper chaperone PCu(A)C [Microbispora oryzae]MBP2707697.1 copper chaperone PCu(A)C [Microbispora oryzae]